MRSTPGLPKCSIKCVKKEVKRLHIIIYIFFKLLIVCNITKFVLIKYMRKLSKYLKIIIGDLEKEFFFTIALVNFNFLLRFTMTNNIKRFKIMFEIRTNFAIHNKILNSNSKQSLKKFKCFLAQHPNIESVLYFCRNVG